LLSSARAAPAIAKFDLPTLCVENTKEDDRPCPGIQNPKLEVMTLKGDHHFDRNFEPIAARILAKSREPKP
jgi:type IV secretory pathway VirJ component